MKKVILTSIFLATVGCGNKENGSQTNSDGSIPTITPDGQKTVVVNPDSIKISGVEVGLQSDFNSFCEVDGKINHRQTLSTAGEVVLNQYRFNNGGLMTASIKTELVDGKIKQVEVLSQKHIRCSNELIVLNPDKRKIKVVYPESRKIPVIHPSERKIPVIANDSIKISGIEALAQQKFNETCSEQTRINKRDTLSEVGQVVVNQYHLNNGGIMTASIEISMVDGKAKHVNLLSTDILQCK